MKVIVTGSHGLIGTALVQSLVADGHSVTRVVRRGGGGGGVAWDVGAGTIDAAALEGHDAAVHLAGAGIGDKRWSDKRKAEIRGSRVKGTTLFATTMAGLDSPPRVLVSGSAIGFYGDRGDEELDELSSAGTGFLVDLVEQWEAAAAPAADAGIRVVFSRTGIVMSGRGGALKRQLLPFRLGLGGRIGSGKQWTSWISLTDVVRALRFALDTESLSGPVNLTAPEPVTNAELTKAIGRAVERPTILPTPTIALRLLLGKEAVGEMLIASQRVLPRALLGAGFEFEQSTIDTALEHEI